MVALVYLQLHGQDKPSLRAKSSTVFSGLVPLFCWREGVLFPGVPLTCSVARSNDMDLVCDALAGEGWLGVMAWRGRRRIFPCPVCDEVFIDARSLTIHQRRQHKSSPVIEEEPPPPLPKMVCLARIRRAHPMPDGGLIMRVLGVARAEVRHGVPTHHSYQLAQVEVVHDEESPPEPSGWLAQAFESIHGLRGQPPAGLDPNPPGLWLDLLCHLLPLAREAKAELLEESSLRRRYEILTATNPPWDPKTIVSRLLPPLTMTN